MPSSTTSRPGVSTASLSACGCTRARAAWVRPGWQSKRPASSGRAAGKPDFSGPPCRRLDAWKVLARRGGRVFLILDYAETRRDLLVPILRETLKEKEGPIRIVLLARAALDWWDLLKREGDGVGDLLNSPATSKLALGALALTVPERKDSFGYALNDFAGKLERAVPAATLDQPEQEYFERALLLHMTALAAIEGVPIKGEEGEQGVLDFVLDRERKHWRERAAKAGLPATLLPGIGRALAAITLAGGVAGENQAVQTMRALKFFEGQTRDVLVAIGALLPGPTRTAGRASSRSCPTCSASTWSSASWKRRTPKARRRSCSTWSWDRRSEGIPGAAPMSADEIESITALARSSPRISTRSARALFWTSIERREGSTSGGCTIWLWSSWSDSTFWIRIVTRHKPTSSPSQRRPWKTRTCSCRRRPSTC